MSDKPRWLQRLVGFLLDNATVLFTVGVALYVIYRREVAKTISPDELTTAVLAVLALLATSEVVERYRRLGRIEKSSRRVLSLLESRVAERQSALAFFQKPPNYDTYIQTANHIDICGVTRTSTINSQFSSLRERLSQGGIVRVMVIDPESQAPEMSGLRSDTGDSKYYRKRLETTFLDLEYGSPALLVKNGRGASAMRP